MGDASTRLLDFIASWHLQKPLALMILIKVKESPNHWVYSTRNAWKRPIVEV
jgi:hypothetical protein